MCGIWSHMRFLAFKLGEVLTSPRRTALLVTFLALPGLSLAALWGGIWGAHLSLEARLSHAASVAAHAALDAGANAEAELRARRAVEAVLGPRLSPRIGLSPWNDGLLVRLSLDRGSAAEALLRRVLVLPAREAIGSAEARRRAD